MELTIPVNQVQQVYRELNRAIDDMDNKVQHVIQKHEAEFLYAYRNHIAKIKKELAEIKHKSEEQEKMFSSNDRIQYLEKEMVIFREEALKLYSKLDEKVQENQILKNKIRQLQREHFMREIQDRQQLKVSKTQEMTKSLLEVKIQQLQIELQRKSEELGMFKSQIQTLKEENGRKNVVGASSEKVVSLATSRRGQSLKEKVKKIDIYDSEMKEWFLDCIRTVKREIAMRNTKNNLLDLSQIHSIDEFKTIDKLKLLELFLQNQKFLTWMYERIFPDRLTQLRSKLQTQNESVLTNNRSQEISTQVQRGYLPKVGRNYVRSELRHSLVVRNGKLNISNL